ncbi:GntR family transcriptional regulator [Pseudomonas sp.]|uniref:GntR family transcriptional regulator n=1 Tax=Pseudomonas sp. TaxID=306 RepID=UPI003CC50AAF
MSPLPQAWSWARSELTSCGSAFRPASAIHCRDLSDTSPLTYGPLIEPSAKRTLASQLESVIRQDIINGRLLPGSRLRLKALALAYELGVIALREALSRLATTGFVAATDQNGFSVGRSNNKNCRSGILNTKIIGK